MELRIQELLFDLDGHTVVRVQWNKEPEGVTDYSTVTVKVFRGLMWKPDILSEHKIDYGSSLHDFFLELIPSEHKHEEILRQLKDYMLTNNPM